MREWWRRFTERRRRADGWQAIAAWAQDRGWQYKPTRGHDGFVIEPSSADAWRLEWGPSHREYLGRHELRLRGSVEIDPLGHAVVFPRGLLGALERELFEAITDGVRTRVDDGMPEEVRWLAVSPRLSGQALGPLKEVLGAAGNVGPWLRAWLGGPTGALLASTLAPDGVPGTPVVLTLHQSVLSLRAAMAEPAPARLQELITLYEMARAEARRCAAETGPGIEPEAPAASSLPPG